MGLGWKSFPEQILIKTFFVFSSKTRIFLIKLDIFQKDWFSRPNPEDPVRIGFLEIFNISYVFKRFSVSLKILILLTKLNYSLIKPNYFNDKCFSEWPPPVPLSFKILILLTKIIFSWLKPNLFNDNEGGGYEPRSRTGTWISSF